MSSSKQGGENDRRAEGRSHGWLRMYAAVLEFLAYLAVLGYIGWLLDERRGWKPWGLLGGLCLGTGMGLYRLIREGERLNK